MAKVSEEDRQAAWNAWYRWLADRDSGTPSKSEQCNTYYAEAIAHVRAEGYRAGVEAAIKAATDYKATWPENKPELWAIRGAIEYTIEEVRALAETGGNASAADNEITRQPCAHFNQQFGRCAYGEDYPACAEKCCVRKE